MAEAKVDPAVITLTQESLGKYVKKPPLTEKLLKKPPFRFLHDLFNAVIKETGYFEGLYTKDELNIENIKDRDDKMRFLQKMVDLVAKVTETPLTVKPSKIVAGHEPEKTNELLQRMAQVIEKQLDWRAALPEGSTNATKDTKGSKDNKESKDSKPSKSKEKPEKAKEKDSNKAKENRKDNNDEKAPLSKTSKERPSKEKEKKDSKDKPVSKARDKDRDKEKEKSRTSQQKTGTSSRLKKTSSVSSSSPEGAKRSKESSISPPKHEKRQTAAMAAPAIKEQPPKESQRRREETQEVVKEPQKASNSSPMAEAKGGERPSSPSPPFQQVKYEEPPKEDPRPPEVMQPAEVVADLERKPSPKERKIAGRKTSAGKSSRREETSPVEAQQPARKTEAKVTSPEATAIKMELKRESTFVQETNNNNNKNNNTINKVKEPVVAAAAPPVPDVVPKIETRPRTSLRPPSARPASARPGAPRRRDKNVEIILQPNDQVKMNGINVKVESFGDLDDDGENLVIIEQATADFTEGAGDSMMANAGDPSKIADIETDSQQGHLVQQIIETQKQLTQQSGAGGKEKDSPSGSALGGRQSSARQMNTLRDVIQNLTTSVHPFAKLMDFIPEDIDAMQLEMTMWRDTYSQASSELKRERGLTESVTKPMKQQLMQIEANIKEYVDMVATSRMKVLQNSEKILKMLTEQ